MRAILVNTTMAARLEIDWAVAAALRTSGASYKQIAEKLGVKLYSVARYFLRHPHLNIGRVQLDKRVEQTVQNMSKSVQLDSMVYKLQAERVTKKHLKYLEENGISSEKSLVQRSIALNNTNTVAKTVYGLDNAAVNVAVNMVNLDSTIPEVTIDSTPTD